VAEDLRRADHRTPCSSPPPQSTLRVVLDVQPAADVGVLTAMTCL
jgi:hypothetical protein